MIIVRFHYIQKSPSGGNGCLEESIKFFEDDISANELESKIGEFLKDNKNGYRTNIIVKSIERI